MTFLIVQEKEPSDYQIRNSEIVIDLQQRQIIKDRFGAPEKLLANLSWAQEIVRSSMSRDLARRNEREIAHLQTQIAWLQKEKQSLQNRVQELEISGDYEQY